MNGLWENPTGDLMHGKTEGGFDLTGEDILILITPLVLVASLNFTLEKVGA